ncbi:MAG: LysE family translocator [Synergistaceae bacterium]|jgi:threonine/homoserine/homoserine lactone efflux protein|nr:LysE family translocator [Synergistaceae bacterium]
MYIDGLRFGMILQLAIGPISLMVFNAAGSLGFLAGSLAAVAVTLTDGVFILLAGLGVSAFLQNKRVKKAVQLFGAAVLVIFGLDILGGAFGKPLIPQIRLFDASRGAGVFMKAVLLTASNPMTIIFWGGVFSGSVIEKNMTPHDLKLFGLGCVSATLFFMHVVALAGTLTGSFLSRSVLTYLNALVGVVIIGFAIKMLVKMKRGS